MIYWYWEVTAIDDNTGQRVEIGDLYGSEGDPSMASIEAAARKDLEDLGYTDIRDFYISEIYYDLK
ncbi:hypothetical protein AHiyo6_00300 [Arthrobacter sp. Hiyo6]|nr:hypothetical protein AHiyo6_00300 [Arthrobacter sp. Hiyo6]